MRDLAERMLVLFRGHQGAHGTYGREDRSSGRAKVEIKKTAKTLRDPPTAELWLQHLEGERPLGIVPISEEGVCWWGVIDVDLYNLVHRDVAARVAKIGLPLILCRSKSGGAHLFLFLSSPVPAAELVEKLREIAASLGYGESEIFPKQTEVLSSRGDTGNWLNMPYFRADGGDRYAVDAEGRGLSIEKFLSLAEGLRQSPEQMSQLSARTASTDDDLSDGPPCLQYLAGTGVSEGGRNNALFAFGVLAKKKYGDAWEPALERWNQKFIQPALSTEELMLVIRSLRKKDYSYKCKDTPICNHCDMAACRQRRHGVGAEATPDISAVSILDTTPPLFFVCLTSGGTVECSSDDILSSRAFQRAALEQLRVLLPLYKQDAWLAKMQSSLETATVIEAPREVSTDGAFFNHLEQFCTDRFAARERDEITLGKPWHDEDRQRYYFRLQDIEAHLEQRRFRELTRQQITSRIREMGGEHDFFNLRGKGVNVWWIPAERFSRQTEAYAVPRLEESPL